MGARPVIMPKYGLQQDEGTVVRWFKQEGDRVEEGEALLELESDKALFEHVASEGGVLRKIVAAEGAVVPVLSVIAVLTDDSDELFDLDSLLASHESEVQQGETSEEPSPAAATLESGNTGGGDRLRRSPTARKRAEDLGVDLSRVSGTGPRGRITRVDVERAAEGVGGDREGRIPLSRMRQAIALAMTESKTTIPHFYVTAEIDMTDAEVWRKSAAMELSVTDVVVKAVAVALTRFPRLNASLVTEDGVVEHPQVNIGLAVATDDGLLVPVLADAGGRTLPDLAEERVRAVENARKGKLRGSERATFTVSNLGMFGVTSFSAIINPPEAAALALGAILPQARPIGDPSEIVVRQVMQVTMAADHRIVDGAEVGRYLQTLKGSLESVETIGGWM